MTNELVPVCLRFGVYEMGLNGKIVDKRECTVCHGDSCPYEVGEPVHGVCPQCFGTGLTPVDGKFELMNGADSSCVRCGGAGRL